MSTFYIALLTGIFIGIFIGIWILAFLPMMRGWWQTAKEQIIAWALGMN